MARKTAPKKELAPLPPMEEALIVAQRTLNAQTAARFNAQKWGDLKWQNEKMYALQIIERATTDALAKAVMANPLSLVTALLDVAALGLTLSPQAGLVYLIPEAPKAGMTQSVNAKVSYKGMEQAVLSSGTVSGITTRLVYANDSFELGENETGTYVNFKQARGDRGALEGGFCRATYANGFSYVEWMSTVDFDAIEAQATKKNFGKKPFTYTGGFSDEMKKKGIVRRASKHWPRSPVIDRVMAQYDREVPMDFSDAIEGTAVEVLNAVEIAGLEKMLEAIPEEMRIVWLQRVAEAKGYPGIEFVPVDLLTDITAMLVKRRDMVLERKAAFDAQNTEQPLQEPTP
jgi:phage RecT family recombinase